MVQIVIHRTRAKDLDETFKLMASKLRKKYVDLMKVRKRDRIDIADIIHVYFRCGDFQHLQGMRPNIFNTDDIDAQIFLRLNASYVGGDYVPMDEIMKKLLGEEETENDT